MQSAQTQAKSISHMAPSPPKPTAKERRGWAKTERLEALEEAIAKRVEEAKAVGCEPCVHSAKEGWWGPLPKGCKTHCHSCHRSWGSLREAHCTVCCRHFTSERVADRHRSSEGCLDPEAMQRRDGKPLFVARERPNGITWALAFYGERPAHWK